MDEINLELSFLTDSFAAWMNLRSESEASEQQVRNRIPERKDILDLVLRGKSLYQNLRSDADTEFAVKYYELLEGLLEMRMQGVTADAATKIIEAIGASCILDSAKAIRGRSFSRAMYSLLDVIHFLGSYPKEFLEHLPERIRELTEEAISDWEDKFTPEKTMLSLILLTWRDDLYLSSLGQPPTPSVELITKRLPLNRSYPVEIQFTVESLGLSAPTLQLESDSQEVAPLSPEHEGLERCSWGLLLKPAKPRVGAYDFSLKIIQADNPDTSPPRTLTIKPTIHDENNSYLCQEVAIDFVYDNFQPPTLNDDPVEEWVQSGKKRIEDSLGARFVVTLPGHQVGNRRLDADSFQVSMEGSTVLRSEDTEWTHISALPEGIFILEIPNHFAVYKLLEHLSSASFCFWYAHLADLLRMTFPGLVFTEGALLKLEELLWPIDEASLQKAVLGHISQYLKDFNFLYLDEGGANQVCERARAPLDLIVGTLSRSFDQLHPGEQDLLRHLAIAIDERRKAMGGTTLRTIAVELGQIRNHFGSGIVDIDLFSGMEGLVGKRWCRREGGLLYSFSSEAHLKCAREKRGNHAA